MQLRSGKSEKEKFSEWINDPSVFMETVTDLHPLDDDENQSLWKEISKIALKN